MYEVKSGENWIVSPFGIESVYEARDIFQAMLAPNIPKQVNCFERL